MLLRKNDFKITHQKYVILGGVSLSYETVQSKSMKKFFKPKEPSVAVLKGAVLRGHQLSQKIEIIY